MMLWSLCLTMAMRCRRLNAVSMSAGGGRTLRVHVVSGVVADFTGIQGDAIYPLRLSQVMVTRTTASEVVGLLSWEVRCQA